MGGLLSEASLMGKFSNWDPKITGGTASVQPAEVITDSLDACIAAAQMRFSGVSKQPHNEHHSSILDAEQTCDAFSMKRLPSSSKDTLSLDATTRGTFQDADSKFKFPKTPQVSLSLSLSMCTSSSVLEMKCLMTSYGVNSTSSSVLEMKWLMTSYGVNSSLVE